MYSQGVQGGIFSDHREIREFREGSFQITGRSGRSGTKIYLGWISRISL